MGNIYAFMLHLCIYAKCYAFQWTEFLPTWLARDLLPVICNSGEIPHGHCGPPSEEGSFFGYTLLFAPASSVATYGLTCPAACGILVL